MTKREALLNDWSKSYQFFPKTYRENHSLDNKEFWECQYENLQYVRSFICLNDQNEIVDHVGVNFQDGIAWKIYACLDEKCTRKGVLGKLYYLARQYYSLMATAANEADLSFYKNMCGIRCYDLVRYMKNNPVFKEETFEFLCKEIRMKIDNLIVEDTYYFQQPLDKKFIIHRSFSDHIKN